MDSQYAATPIWQRKSYPAAILKSLRELRKAWIHHIPGVEESKSRCSGLIECERTRRKHLIIATRGFVILCNCGTFKTLVITAISSSEGKHRFGSSADLGRYSLSQSAHLSGMFDTDTCGSCEATQANCPTSLKSRH